MPPSRRLMLKLPAKDVKAAIVKLFQSVITNTFETNKKRDHLRKEIENLSKEL